MPRPDHTTIEVARRTRRESGQLRARAQRSRTRATQQIVVAVQEYELAAELFTDAVSELRGAAAATRPARARAQDG